MGTMGWIQATFTNRSGKSQTVWAETDDDGEFVVADGRVSMKYSNDEDAKVYNANPRNLSLDSDGSTRRSSKKSKKSKSKSKSTIDYDDLVWREPEGRLVSNEEAPVELEDEPEPPPGVIDAWTDGACTGNPGPCGYGVILRHDGEYQEFGQYVGLGTNNIAELLAILVAVKQGRSRDGKLRIHTDSNYSIGVLTKGWKAKANVELIQAIKDEIAECEQKPEFVKVKGHAGIPLNERADQLAVEAVERRK